MKRTIIIFVSVILVFCGVYLIYHQRTNRVNTTDNTKLETNNFYTVQKGSIIKTISANGYINPKKIKDLTFMTSGRVKTVNVLEGQKVNQGDLLASLDNLSEELALTRAQHNYDQAKINSSPMVKKERTLELEIARQNYNNTFLYAPFDGVITTLDLETGDQVNSSTTVIQIIDNSTYIIALNIDEVDISQVQFDQVVIVSLEAFPDLVLRGRVKKIGMTAYNQNGVVVIPVEVELDNLNSQVKPGLSASAEIVVGQANDEIVVPITAITTSAQGTFVMKKNGQEIQPVKVETGISNDIMIVIKEGLVEGDQIVVNNFEAVQSLRNRALGMVPFNGGPFAGNRGGMR